MNVRTHGATRQQQTMKIKRRVCDCIAKRKTILVNGTARDNNLQCIQGPVTD